MPIVLVAYADLMTRVVRPPASRVVALGLSALLPSVLFFIWHRYRGENYNLPVIAGVFLLLAAALLAKRPAFTRVYAGAISLVAVVFMLLAAVVAVAVFRFMPLPEWWSMSSILGFFAASLVAASVFWMVAVQWRQKIKWSALVGACAVFYLGLGGLMTVFGEHELDDLRAVIQEERAQGRQVELSYYNLHYALWSEAGLMGFMIGQPVRALQTETQLVSALKSGAVLLLPGDEYLKMTQELMARELPGQDLQIWSWRRWRTQGKNQAGQSLLSEAWRLRDLTVLEKSYSIVRLR
jgi:hypothetical protein